MFLVMEKIFYKKIKIYAIFRFQINKFKITQLFLLIKVIIKNYKQPLKNIQIKIRIN